MVRRPFWLLLPEVDPEYSKVFSVRSINAVVLSNSLTTIKDVRALLVTIEKCVCRGKRLTIDV